MATPENPFEAFVASLEVLPDDAPSACAGWSAHEVAAHLVAGGEEVVELIEDTLAQAPSRPTRGFEEREAPYRAMSPRELRAALRTMLDRVGPALGELAGRGATVDFFDRSWSAEELQLHSANEFALHRWDLIGDDALGDRFLSPQHVTESAVATLNLLPVLEETPTARARRHGLVDLRVVLRSPSRPDVLLAVDAEGTALLETAGDGHTLDGDVIVATDAVNRLLTLWGRRSGTRPVSITGDPVLWPVVAGTLWEGAHAWAPRTAVRTTGEERAGRGLAAAGTG